MNKKIEENFKLFDKMGKLSKPPSNNLFAPPIEQLMDEVIKKWPPEQQRVFEKILDSLNYQIEDMPDTQIAAAAVAYCMMQDALKSKPKDKTEMEYMEWVRKIYNENFNTPVSEAKTRVQQNNFLEQLEQIIAANRGDPIELKSKFAPGNLAIPSNVTEKDMLEDARRAADEKEALLKQVPIDTKKKKGEDEGAFLVGMG